ncbi:hypothetical protein J4E85_009906 [Alternaria conjuncta]|uniref:uncharacterized protein n=1 Tax=Alternaria conjuncta TaxID=181017 RepID=UPI00221F12B0|nr:uncharacterized protein J4E85_009906 [Alternaria conjuncta]KAI4917814.1 hypothetical protein J4E85_009906 [Alternaria conjuncta]
MPYNRDVVVSCIEKHYDLLVRMAYLDPDTILRPPPEGWTDEQLAVDTLQEWKRSDRVIDLLRHLPYLSKNMGDSKYEVYIVTEACNYLRNYGWLKDADKKKAIRRMSPCGEGQEIPAGMIPLSQGNEATVWMIDTDQGIIWPMGPFIVDRSAPDDQFWRQAAKPREVQQYFDELYDEIETLVTVPVPLTRGSDAWYNEMVDHRDNNAKVSAILSANVTGRLIKQMNSYPSAC